MKSLLLFFAAATIGAIAAEPVADNVRSLELIHGNPPIFPREMIQQGVREGYARIAFSVDVNGKVDDCLPVSYSDPEFARVSVATLKKWQFKPAKYRGEAVAAVSDLVVRFETEGMVIVSLTSPEAVANMFRAFTREEDKYRPRTLKELDRIPAPVSAPSPVFPTQLAKPGVTQHVTVSFFIDESGAVRLPGVSAADEAELGAYAIEALRQWKFEPPTVKGRPVLVRASQRFNFQAPKVVTK